MSRPKRKVKAADKELISEMVKTARNANELRAVQCMHLRITKNMSAKEIAKIIGWSEIGVKRVQCDFFKRGIEALQRTPSEHRRRGHMSREEEALFPEQFQVTAKAGRILEISTIREALQLHLGHRVGKTTVYDMLHRHNWRQITPRPRHPGASDEAQEAFKKTDSGNSQDY